MPRGVEHAFHVLSAEGAKLLAAFTPGGFESFFEAVAAEGLTLPQDEPRINEIAERFRLRLAGPPMGAPANLSLASNRE